MNNSKISFRVDVAYEETLQQVIDNYNHSYQTDFCIADVYIHTDGWCFCAIEVSKDNEQHIFDLGYQLAIAEQQSKKQD